MNKIELVRTLYGFQNSKKVEIDILFFFLSSSLNCSALEGQAATVFREMLNQNSTELDMDIYTDLAERGLTQIVDGKTIVKDEFFDFLVERHMQLVGVTSEHLKVANKQLKNIPGWTVRLFNRN